MRLLSFLAYLLVRVLGATLRIRHVRPENLEGTPQYVITFWHSHLLPVLARARWRGPIAVMVSRSDDGNLSASVLKAFGVDAARGSSSRGGGAALRELLRYARSGKNLVFTPDGPRGPARIAKDGVIYAARASGLPIVPVAYGSRKRMLLRSWDRMIIPHPFSRGVFAYGEPMLVPRDGDNEEWRVRLEQTLNALTDEAERMVNER